MKTKPETAPKVPVARPFIKWAGGKRRLLKEILERAPKEIDTYYEPFVGGGAVFFALAAHKRFKTAVLNDLNVDLINTYRAVQSTELLPGVIEILGSYPHDREFYLEMRVKVSSELTPVEQAARFIYLNKTSYNGLYRVNKKGQFNAPFGAYDNPTICDEGNLMRAHEALQGVTLLSQDFVAATQYAKEGDFVYFDPPYMPLSETSNFVSYTSSGFNLNDHTRLSGHLGYIRATGAKALVSNSDTPTVRALFQGFELSEVRAPRSINSKGGLRGLVGELLISN